MHFRSQKKLQGEVSLSDTLETDKDGQNLFLLDVVGTEDTMLEDLDARDTHVRLRYGLGGQAPLTQREIASLCGISRSYVSRRH